MDYYHHARLIVGGREQLAKSVIEGRQSLVEAAAECRLCRQSAAKRVERYRLEGLTGLRDRSCRLHRSPRQNRGGLAAHVEALRRQRWTGVRVGLELQIGPATVSRILRRLKLNRIRDIKPQLPVVRYEHNAPGETCCTST
jgi:hypothetical protein